MRITKRAADGRLLSFEEVVAASEPATFSVFGDHLLFLDGIVYALTRSPGPSDLVQPMSIPGAYVVTQTAGIEFGWQHLHECTCDLCLDDQQKQVA